MDTAEPTSPVPPASPAAAAALPWECAWCATEASGADPEHTAGICASHMWSHFPAYAERVIASLRAEGTLVEP
jgi:hypothetical protein